MRRVVAIGDVHGQYDALMRLLDAFSYDEARDLLWFVGDFVNRGPKSLEVLRFVVERWRASKAEVVIGNHDFTLMVHGFGLDQGRVKKSSKALFEAHDGEVLLEAMAAWPLLVYEPSLSCLMAHAGVYPFWSLEEALQMAKAYRERMDDVLGRRDFLRAVYRNGGGRWHQNLQSDEALCFAVNAFTRMRYLDGARGLDYALKCAPENTQARPWFLDYSLSCSCVFGHWAALGFRVGKSWACLDAGAAWGKAILAFDVAAWQVLAAVRV